MEGAAVEERPEEVHRAGRAVVVGPAARVARDVDREVGAAVVRAVRREHLDPPGVQPRHPDRVLVGVGSPVGEEHLVEVTGRVARDQPGRLRPRRVGVLRGDRAQVRRLLLDRGHDPGVLVAQVREDELGREVQQPLTVLVPDVRALGLGDHHRVQRALGGPGVEDVLAVQLLDAVGGQVDEFRPSAVLRHFAGIPARGRPAGGCAGSIHRVVTTLPRVKKWTPSAPWAWVSPSSDRFQPPKE